MALIRQFSMLDWTEYPLIWENASFVFIYLWQHPACAADVSEVSRHKVRRVTTITTALIDIMSSSVLDAVTL